MKETTSFTEEIKHDQLTDSLPYLLAGFEGRTSGHKVTGITVQQAGLSGYRVVLRAIGVDGTGDPICLVSFTTGDTAGGALLLAEDAYKADVIQWKVDRFAKSLSDNGNSKNGSGGLTLVD